MGSFDKKTKTSSKTSGTATTTPNVPAFIQQPAQNFYSSVSSLLAEPTGTTATAPTANQRAAFAGGSSLSTPNAAIDQGIDATRALTGFTPGNVQAGQLATTDLTQYLNPYTQNVIDSSVSDLDRARAMTIASNQGAATQAGAYGGSRHGIVDSETNRGFLDNVGSLVANLRNTGYQNAQTAALADINNRIGVDTGNADRGVTGAGLRLNAAGQLGGQGVAADANARSNLTTQAGLGEMERQLNAENDPVQQRIARLTEIARLLGIDPSQFIGQTINQSGASSGTQKDSGGFQVGWSAKDGLSFGFG